MCFRSADLQDAIKLHTFLWMCALKRLHTSYISSQEINIIRAAETSLNKYRGADKSLARPGRKQARKDVRDARDFNNIETWAVIKSPLHARHGAEGNCLLASRQQYPFDKCLLLYVQSWTADDGRKDRPKNVECHCKINKFDSLAHLVGFSIEMHYDARPCERQTTFIVPFWRSILTQTSAQPLVHNWGRGSMASPVPSSVSENLTAKCTAVTNGMSVKNGLIVGNTGHCSQIPWTQ